MVLFCLPVWIFGLHLAVQYCDAVAYKHSAVEEPGIKRLVRQVAPFPPQGFNAPPGMPYGGLQSPGGDFSYMQGHVNQMMQNVMQNQAAGMQHVAMMMGANGQAPPGPAGGAAVNNNWGSSQGAGISAQLPAPSALHHGTVAANNGRAATLPAPHPSHVAPHHGVSNIQTNAVQPSPAMVQPVPHHAAHLNPAGAGYALQNQAAVNHPHPPPPAGVNVIKSTSAGNALTHQHQVVSNKVSSHQNPQGQVVTTIDVHATTHEHKVTEQKHQIVLIHSRSNPQHSEDDSEYDKSEDSRETQRQRKSKSRQHRGKQRSKAGGARRSGNRKHHESSHEAYDDSREPTRKQHRGKSSSKYEQNSQNKAKQHGSSAHKASKARHHNASSIESAEEWSDLAVEFEKSGKVGNMQGLPHGAIQDVMNFTKKAISQAMKASDGNSKSGRPSRKKSGSSGHADSKSSGPSDTANRHSASPATTEPSSGGFTNQESAKSEASQAALQQSSSMGSGGMKTNTDETQTAGNINNNESQQTSGHSESSSTQSASSSAKRSRSRGRSGRRKVLKSRPRVRGNKADANGEENQFENSQRQQTPSSGTV